MRTQFSGIVQEEVIVLSIRKGIMLFWYAVRNGTQQHFNFIPHQKWLFKNVQHIKCEYDQWKLSALDTHTRTSTVTNHPEKKVENSNLFVFWMCNSKQTYLIRPQIFALAFIRFEKCANFFFSRNEIMWNKQGKSNIVCKQNVNYFSLGAWQIRITELTKCDFFPFTTLHTYDCKYYRDKHILPEKLRHSSFFWHWKPVELINLILPKSIFSRQKLSTYWFRCARKREFKLARF